MSKFSKFRRKACKVLGFDGKKNDSDSDAEEENENSEENIGGMSMNEGDPGKIMSIKRQWVRGIIVCGLTLLSLAWIYATSDDAPSENQADKTPKTHNSQTASLDNNDSTKGIHASYEELNDYNKKKQAEEAAKMAAANQNKSPENAQQEQPKQTAPRAQIPANYSTLPRIATANPNPQPTPKDDKAERMKSAIAFALGESRGNDAGQTSEKSAEAEQITSPQYIAPNDSTIITGTLIPVRLLTGINSDLTGQVLAQVVSDVYDSATGTKLLIPQGSKIAGTYDNKAVANGRVPLSFQQVNFPDGSALALGNNLVAVDGPGYAGVKGKVNHHTGQKISGGLLGSAIAAMGSVAAGNTGSGNSNTYSAGQLATQGALANLINVTSDMFKQASDVVDTVTIEPGYEFNLYVTENINLGE